MLRAGLAVAMCCLLFGCNESATPPAKTGAVTLPSNAPPSNPVDPIPVSTFDCSTAPSATAYNAIGSGTMLDPYIICTAAQFVNIGQTPAAWSSSFVLGSDIDLSAYDGSTAPLTLSPIGIYDFVTSSNSLPFTGKFSGANHTIANPKIVAATNQAAALFGYTVGSLVSNVAVTGANVSGTQYDAVLIAYDRATPVNNASVAGTVRSTVQATAGLVASVNALAAGEDASVNGCTSTVSIQGGDLIGGLLGHVTIDGGTATTTDSSYSGAISQLVQGNTYGGLIGLISATNSGVGDIKNSSAAGSMTITTYGSFSGGLVGTLGGTNSASVTLMDVSSTVSISDPGSFTINPGIIGGLVGTIGCTSATCNVTRASYNGTITIPSSAAHPFSIGGLFGNIAQNGFMSISDSYANVVFSIGNSTVTNLGGFAGSLNCSGCYYWPISNTYAAAQLTGTVSASSKGAYFGAMTDPSSMFFQDSYWDSSLWASGGSFAQSGLSGATTAQMKQSSTFSWDFTNTWTITNGVTYPTLR